MATDKPKRAPRNEMPEQPAHERARNFQEVPKGYDEQTAKLEANRCLLCKKPACISGCPVGINIPGFIEAIRNGDYAEAVRVMKNDNMLPAVCGRVCPQESQCEAQCVLGKKGQPVAIGNLERFVGDYERAQTERAATEVAPPTGKKIASAPAPPVSPVPPTSSDSDTRSSSSKPFISPAASSSTASPSSGSPSPSSPTKLTTSKPSASKSEPTSSSDAPSPSMNS